MDRFGAAAVLGFLLFALLGLILGCGRAEERLADLGAYGERIAREAGSIAGETFRTSAEARERFAALYPATHHHASAEEFLLGLAADPTLAPMAESVRASLNAELGAPDHDTRNVRARWSDPEVQKAVTHTVSSAVLEAFRAAGPDSGPANAQ